jgi:hypothetical protein
MLIAMVTMDLYAHCHDDHGTCLIVVMVTVTYVHLLLYLPWHLYTGCHGYLSIRGYVAIVTMASVDLLP